jgi:hypothetical protein
MQPSKRHRPVPERQFDGVQAPGRCVQNNRVALYRALLTSPEQAEPAPEQAAGPTWREQAAEAAEAAARSTPPARGGEQRRPSPRYGKTYG